MKASRVAVHSLTHLDSELAVTTLITPLRFEALISLAPMHLASHIALLMGILFATH